MNYIIEDIALLYDLKSADFFLFRMDNYFYMTRIKIKFVIKSYAILPCLVFASIF